jgi:hypothetical protein
MAETDWRAWHDSYSDPTSLLAERLGVVQAFIVEFLHTHDGAVRVISVCSGRGLDLLDVLARHPSRERVSAAWRARRRAEDGSSSGSVCNLTVT